MVSWPSRWQYACLALGAGLVWVTETAAAEPKPLLQRLDPVTRAKVLSALAALILLGLGLMALAWLGARAVRRYMHREPLLRERPRPGTPLNEKDWASRPLVGPTDEETPGLPPEP